MPKAKIETASATMRPEDRRPVRLDVEEREAAQQHDDRQRGDERGQRPALLSGS